MKLKKLLFKKSNKYHNSKCEYDGIKFDSERERDAYLFLSKKVESGQITNLIVHPKWELIPAIKEKYIKHLKTKDKECERTVQLPITYAADFQFDYKGETLYFDIKISKNLRPKEFVLKIKLLRYLKGIIIHEIYKISDFDEYLK